MDKQKWILCPICHNKTRTKIMPDTIASNLPVFCPKCGNSTMMDIRDGKCKLTSERKTVSENYISSGRTENRGNWVRIRRGDFSVRMDSDGKKPISQTVLKEICIDVLNYLNIE